jgi:hypothetical protein
LCLPLRPGAKIYLRMSRMLPPPNRLEDPAIDLAFECDHSVKQNQ